MWYTPTPRLLCSNPPSVQTTPASPALPPLCHSSAPNTPSPRVPSCLSLCHYHLYHHQPTPRAVHIQLLSLVTVHHSATFLPLRRTSRRPYSEPEKAQETLSTVFYLFPHPAFAVWRLVPCRCAPACFDPSSPLLSAFGLRPRGLVPSTFATSTLLTFLLASASGCSFDCASQRHPWVRTRKSSGVCARGDYVAFWLAGYTLPFTPGACLSWAASTSILCPTL